MFKRIALISLFFATPAAAQNITCPTRPVTDSSHACANTAFVASRYAFPIAVSGGTSGGIPYFASATSLASSAALAANQFVVGGGAGVAPATVTTASGVLTAVAIAPNATGGLLTQPTPWVSGNIVKIGPTGGVIDGGSPGSVTSVGLALPSFITVTGSPVTTTGTLTGALATQVKNTIFSGPVTGVDAAPTFRGLSCPDLPGSPCLLNTLTASNSASIQDTTSFASGYPRYDIVFINYLPATSASICEIQIQSSATFQTSGYINNNYTLSTVGIASDTSITAYIPCSRSTVAANAGNAGNGINGTITIYNPAAAAKAMVAGQVDYNCTEGVTICREMISGYWNTAGAVTGIKILQNSGNITSGSVEIYGRL